MRTWFVAAAGAFGLIGVCSLIADGSALRVIASIEVPLARSVFYGLLFSLVSACSLIALRHMRREMRPLPGEPALAPVGLIACVVLGIVTVATRSSGLALLVGAIAGIAFLLTCHGLIRKALLLDRRVVARALGMGALLVGVTRAATVTSGSVPVYSAMLLSYATAFVLTACLPSASTQQARQRNGSPTPDVAHRGFWRWVPLWAFVICIYISGSMDGAVVIGQVMGSSPAPVVETSFAVGTLLSGAVLVVFSFLADDKAFDVAIKAGTISCVAVLLASSFFNPDPGSPAMWLTIVPFGFCWVTVGSLLVMTGLDEDARLDGRTPSSFIDVGLVSSLALLATAIIWQQVGDELANPVCLVMMVTYLATVAVRLIGWRVSDASWEPEELEADTLALACGELRDRCNLSDREVQILLCLARRQGLAQIAEELSISPNTVKTHANRIYQKLGVHTRDEVLEEIRACIR